MSTSSNTPASPNEVAGPSRPSRWQHALAAARRPFRRRDGAAPGGGRPRRARLLPRALKLTREGKYLLLLVFGVGFAAVNSGNNLLYLVFGLLLSLIVVSGVLSELTLRRLSVTVELPAQAHARRPALLRVRLRNGKRRFSSFSVEAELVTDDRRVHQRPASVLHLPPGEAADSFAELLLEERGRYVFPGVRVATRFPFGFFRKSRILPGDRVLVVYPALVDVPLPELPGARAGQAAARPRAGRGDDYYGLRELRAGDDLRDVYWKVSARVGDLVVREYEEPVRRQVTLCFANVATGEDRRTLTDLEDAVSVAASLAVRLSEDGSSVGLVTVDGVLEPEGGARQVHRILRHLALMDVYVAEPGAVVRLARGGEGDRVLVRHVGQRPLALLGEFGIVSEVSRRPPS